MKRKSNLIILLVIIVILCYYQIHKYLKVNYEIDTCFIPVKGGDFNQSEKFVSSILKYKENPSQENKLIMDSLSEYFEYGNYINLIHVDESWGKSNHEFSEKYTIREIPENQVGYLIDNIKYEDGLPVVCVHSTIPVKPYNVFKPDEKVDRAYLTSETEYWPVNHPSILELRNNICKEKKNEKDKIISILDWMDNNLKRGKEQGTRYGPLKFIEKANGRCWDFSDLFITLCRASGIPARQVFGVVYKKGGHSWCQVYLKEKGWVSIDPPKKKFGVNSAYIPLSISETGLMTFLYYSIPEIMKQ
jgi:hypothetical protein